MRLFIRGSIEHWHETFVEIYTGTKAVEVRNECVGAIVYASPVADVQRFLTTELNRQQTSRRRAGLLSKLFSSARRVADIHRLLHGALSIPKLSAELADAVAACLKDRDEEIVAAAYLALERHGIRNESHIGSSAVRSSAIDGLAARRSS